MSHERWAELRAASDGWFESRPAPQVDAAFRSVRGDVHSRRQKRRRGALACGVLLTGVSAALLLFVAQRKGEILAAKVEGRALEVGQVWGDENDRTSVTFSDGSEVQTEKQGHARIASFHAHGAEVRLERGSLHAHVIHQEATRWAVLAGDFAIRVTGTSFDASWDPKTQRVHVRMFEGRVVVFGPCLPSSGVALVAGESQEWTCAPREASLPMPPSSIMVRNEPAVLPTSAPLLAPPAVASSIPMTERQAPTIAPATASVVMKVQESDAAAPAASVAVAAPTWRELAKTRQYAEAWRRAKDTQASEHASVAELIELAELARLGGDAFAAIRLYRSVVDQFAGTPEAARAAFQLGRLSSGTEAYGWFQRYLQVEPNGTFAQEALGRLVELSVARGDRATAAIHARTYLARYPSGSHADYARSVIPP